VDTPDTPVPRTDRPVTPLLNVPEVLSSLPNTPNRAFVADVLFICVAPASPLPLSAMPRMAGPVPLLSYSIHGRELTQVGSMAPPAFAGGGSGASRRGTQP